MIRSGIVAAIVVVVAVGLSASPAASAAEGKRVSADEYVQKAALADMLEIESSKLALEKAQSQPLKKFAGTMVDDHSASTNKIKSAISMGKVSVSLPSELDAKHRQTLDQLRGLSGTEFDKKYLDVQIKGHEEALRLHQSYAEDGDNKALKDAATDIVKVVERHLKETRALSGTASQT